VMTDNRTTELLPCPFCGGEAEIVALDAWYKNPFVGIGCSKCPAILAEYGEYKRFYTEAEAIAAWNARAERTCHIEYPYYGDAPVINAQPRCSECHEHFAVGEFPNYCPSCGAKVIGG